MDLDQTSISTHIIANCVILIKKKKLHFKTGILKQKKQK